MLTVTRSKRIVASLLALIILLAATAYAQKPGTSASNARSTAAAKTHLATRYGRLPLAFEPNVGQVDKRVRFLTHTGQGTLFLTDTEVVLTIPCKDTKAGKPAMPSRLIPMHRFGKERHAPRKYAVLRMKLTGAQKPVRTIGLEKLPGIVNYFRGNDPKNWHSNIPTYRQAKFAGVYKGVDILYYGTQNGKLEYDFVVKPGASPKAIKLAFSGATGARVTATGDLLLQTAAGEVRWQRPVTYQMIGGHREAVACAYELKHEDHQTQVGFRLARYDTSRPVVIDPTLQYSTFLGGSDSDGGCSIAVDSSDNAYVTGQTYSSDFPTTPGAFQTALPGYTNAFITKLNANGSALIYSTYLGGSYEDYGYGIAVDSSDNAYVTGQTDSFDFPTTPGAFQTFYPGSGSIYYSSNAFVTKLSADGSSLVYSTYLGGIGNGTDGDIGYGIAVDSSDNAYVTGQTYSSDFPTTPGAFQTALPGFDNAFITKLSADGSSLIYSTYLGGTDSDNGNGIAVDSSGNAYVTGSTGSSDFPTTPGAFQTALPGFDNAFITKLSADGSSLIYSTYFGSSFKDNGSGIALDSSDNAYMTGWTYSADFPTTSGAFQTTFHSDYSTNAFISKFLFANLFVITNLTVTNITSSSATIRWNTNLNASTLVNYGTTTAYGSTATGAANVTTHSVTLTGLSPNTLYYFQVSSTASGDTATQTGSFLTSHQTAPQIVVSGYKFTRSGSDLFVDITLSNTGTATAQNIQITKATLGSKTSSGLPVAFPAIAAGGMYTLVHALHFNSADFPSGTRTVLSGSGTYNGGSYSAATRVTVP